MPIIPNDTPIPTQTPYVPTVQDIVWNTFWGNIGLFSWIIGGLVILYIIIWIYRRKKAKNRLLFKDFNVGNYVVKMYRKIGDRYVEIEKKRLKVTDGKFRYNNKDFTVFKINKIAFSDRRNNYYAFDYDTGTQLTFSGTKMPKEVSIEDVDTYVNRGIIADLVKGLEDLKPKSQWILLIAGLALGIGLGIIIGIYAIPHPTNTVYLNATQTPTPFSGVFQK